MKKRLIVILLFFSKVLSAQQIQIAGDSSELWLKEIARVDSIIRQIDYDISLNRFSCFDTTHDPERKMFFYNKFIISEDDFFVKKIVLESNGDNPKHANFRLVFYFERGAVVKVIESRNNAGVTEALEIWFFKDKPILMLGSNDKNDDHLSLAYNFFKNVDFFCRRSKSP